MPRDARWMVVPPPALREVRTCRLLRFVAVAARQPSCREQRAPRGPELRAQRGLVLRLHERRGVPGSGPRATARAPHRPTHAGSRRTRPRRLDVAPALTTLAGSER